MARQNDGEDSLTRFILHIGPHKTGTTYLQHMLHALRDVLLERGIYIPSIWNAAPDDPSHVRLVRAIRRRDVGLVRKEIEEILAQRYRCVVITCEGLSTFNLDQAGRLRELLGPAPTQVVHYIRRWPDRLPSAWKEHVRQGNKVTFPEFALRQLMGHEGFARPDAAILDTFSAVFGADQIKIVSYSYLVDNGIDIAGHFLTALLDQNDIPLPDVGRPNRSLSIFDTELIRALNAIRNPHGNDWSTAVRDWYLANKDGLAPASLHAVMRASVGSIHLDEAKPPLAHLWRDILTRYRTSLVSPWARDSLHEPAAIDVPFVRQDYLLEPGVPKVLGEIFEEFLQAQEALPPRR